MTGLLLAIPSATSEASVCPALRGAASGHHAGLVVAFGDGSVSRVCVAFPEDEISGFELLRRSGLPLIYQDFGGSSVAVCRIGPDGCDYPTRPCFCQCRNTQQGCRFWGYYTIDHSSGAWRFENAGASIRRVRDGDVDGWRWGSHMPNASPPPEASLASVCAASSPITTGSAAVPAPSNPTTTVTARGLGSRGGSRAPSVPALAAVVVGALVLGGWGVVRLRAARRSPR